MHFGLSDEQKLLQETLRGFCQTELPPMRRRELFDAGVGHDPELWRALADMGITGLLAPEARGGAGLGVLELALVCEIAGAACLPGALLEHALAVRSIDRAGSPAQRAHWLPRLASGRTLGSVAFGERSPAGDAWRPEDWTARERDGRLAGEKAWVPHLDAADLVVVGLEGGGLALLETGSGEGIDCPDSAGIDRTRPIRGLRLDGARGERLPGSSDPEIARAVLDAGLVGLAADAFGAATRLIAACVEYAQQRVQFGFPIAQFQAVKHQIARMGTSIEPTRALFWYAAHALDVGAPDAARHAAMAKAQITDCAMETARAAVELHGGLGFTWECDVQLWFKRAMFDRACLGTPAVQRERMAEMAGW